MRRFNNKTKFTPLIHSRPKRWLPDLPLTDAGVVSSIVFREKIFITIENLYYVP